MKVLLQRVNYASVEVAGQTVGKIDRGLLLLVGIGKDDSQEQAKAMVEKIINLRVFPDENGRFHYSVLDISGEVLLVPQFTLYGDTSKGRRPEFFSAMHPKDATKMFDQFVEIFRSHPIKKVATGVFGADMKVALENDGPVTLMIEM